MHDSKDPPYSEAVYRALQTAGIRQVGYVPDAGLAGVIRRCEDSAEIRAVPLTTEEEGVALACGAWLGGQRAALLLQSSGVGNCINMLAMVEECRFPLLMLVTMRGRWGEFNPWQVPMGEGTRQALENAGVLVRECDQPDRVAESVAAAAHMAFSSYRALAVLIGQRAIGAKTFDRGSGSDD